MVMKCNGLQYADKEPLFCSIILIVIAVAGLKYKSQVMSLTLWPVLYKPNWWTKCFHRRKGRPHVGNKMIVVVVVCKFSKDLRLSYDHRISLFCVN